NDTPALLNHQEGAKVKAQNVQVDESGTARFLKEENGRSREQKERMERGEEGQTAVADKSNLSGAGTTATRTPGKAFEDGEDDPL
ncbi:hypothetical protein LTS18_005780, partial [Coniosporium uncinatum]